MPKRHIEIPLDKMRKLKYNMNAMIELEDMFGGGIAKIFDPGGAALTTARALIYVGLKCGGDSRITLDTTGDLLSQYVLEPGKPIEEVFLLAMEALCRGGFMPAENVKAARKAYEKSQQPDDEDDEGEEDDESPPVPEQVTEDQVSQ